MYRTMIFLVIVLFSACAKKSDSVKNGPPLNLKNPTNLLTKIEQKELQKTYFGAKNGVYIVKLEYDVTLKNGEVMRLSGLLNIPDIKSQHPLVAHQHGTRFRKSRAPTIQYSSNLGLSTAAYGAITVVADYIGFGLSADKFHPYLVADSYGPDVVGLIGAAVDYLADQDVQVPELLNLMGYSEGGYATAAVWRHLQLDYQNNVHGLKLHKVSMGGSPLGLLDITLATFAGVPSASEHLAYPPFIPYVFLGYQNEYGGLAVDEYFHSPFAESFEKLYNGEVAGDDIFDSFLAQDPNSDGAVAVGELLKRDIRPEVTKKIANNSELVDPLVEKIFENDLSIGWQPEIAAENLFFFHCENDEMVPIEGSRAFESLVGQKVVTEKTIGENEISVPYEGVGSVHIGCAGPIWGRATLRRFGLVY